LSRVRQSRAAANRCFMTRLGPSPYPAREYPASPVLAPQAAAPVFAFVGRQLQFGQQVTVSDLNCSSSTTDAALEYASSTQQLGKIDFSRFALYSSPVAPIQAQRPICSLETAARASPFDQRRCPADGARHQSCRANRASSLSIERNRSRPAAIRYPAPFAVRPTNSVPGAEYRRFRQSQPAIDVTASGRRARAKSRIFVQSHGRWMVAEYPFRARRAPIPRRWQMHQPFCRRLAVRFEDGTAGETNCLQPVQGRLLVGIQTDAGLLGSDAGNGRV